jgi:ribosomal protein S26
MGKAMLMNALSFFCLASISLYSALTMDMKQTAVKKLLLATLATAGIYRLYSICNTASYVTYCVRLASFCKGSKMSGIKLETIELHFALNMSTLSVQTFLQTNRHVEECCLLG